MEGKNIGDWRWLSRLVQVSVYWQAFILTVSELSNSAVRGFDMARHTEAYIKVRKTAQHSRLRFLIVVEILRQFCSCIQESNAS